MKARHAIISTMGQVNETLATTLDRHNQTVNRALENPPVNALTDIEVKPVVIHYPPNAGGHFEALAITAITEITFRGRKGDSTE